MQKNQLMQKKWFSLGSEAVGVGRREGTGGFLRSPVACVLLYMHISL